MLPRTPATALDRAIRQQLYDRRAWGCWGLQTWLGFNISRGKAPFRCAVVAYVRRGTDSHGL